MFGKRLVNNVVTAHTNPHVKMGPENISPPCFGVNWDEKKGKYREKSDR